MRLALITLAIITTGCEGAAASDAALCHDVAIRLCASPRCPAVDQHFTLGQDCVTTLEIAANCTSEAFAFNEALSRNRMLECRLPLVRQSTSNLVAPGCDNVNETLLACPDLVRFYKGTP